MSSSHVAVLSIVSLLAAAIGINDAAEGASGKVRTPAGYTRNVAIVLYQGVELLDFAGPGEVFAAAASQGSSQGREAFRVFTVAASKAPLTSQGFLKVTPDYSWEDAPEPDVVVIPGGNTENLLDDPKFMAWLGKTSPKAEISLTVCTGAFTLARAGLLDGAQATTWYGAVDRLRKEFPKTTVTEGRRFVDNGSTITTAGVSAGIDGSLHVVARLLGREVADKTARYMEYHWTPESYLARNYSYLNPSLDERGRRLQQAKILEDEKSYAEAAKAYRALIADDPKDGFSWYRLGATLHAAGEMDAAIDAARRATEFPEVRSDAFYNIACAHALQGKKADALRDLEDAVASGFKTKWLLMNDPDLEPVRGEARFQKLLESL